MIYNDRFTKNYCRYSIGWICWHWGLFVFAFLPHYIAIPVIRVSLVIDGLLFLGWFYYTYRLFIHNK